MKITIKSWHAIASWKWAVDEECCGICRMPFDSYCSQCKTPGDDCPPGKYIYFFLFLLFLIKNFFLILLFSIKMFLKFGENVIMHFICIVF
jgi:hypothetical protein